MKRIACVTTIRDGREADLREAETSLPADELQSLGIHGVETFIGSGYYIIVLELAELDFQATMQRLFDEPAVQGYLDKLRPHVAGLPARSEAFTAGDDKHAGAQAAQRGATLTTVTSADLPLAASSYHWTAGSGPADARPNGGSMDGGSRLPDR